MTTPSQVVALVSDADVVRRDLARALKAMGERNPFIDLAWRYYDGDHPALWLSEKMAEMFSGHDTRLHDNLCGLAVDTVLSRLNATGWSDLDTEQQQTPPDTEGGLPLPDITEADLASTMWAQNGLDLLQEDVYRHALVSAVGYVLVWVDKDGNPEALPQDPRNMHVEYGSTRIGDIKWAAKVWHEDDFWHACVFYPDRMVRMITTTKSDESKRPEAQSFVLNDEDPGGPNPLPVKRVPVVPFDLRRGGRSWLWNLTPPQDKINKLAANKMVAAEFAAFRQRVFITTQEVDNDTLRNAPDRAIVLDPGTRDAPTSVFEMAVTELANYDQAIAAEINRFFTIAGLPRHLIVGDSGAGGMSGEFIKMDEGPFVAFVDRLIARFTAAWSDVMALLGLNVAPTWAETEVHNDESTSRTVKGFTDAGAPLGTVLRRYAGWDDAEVAEADAAAAAAQAQAAAAGALALAAFDQGAAPENAMPPL